MLVTIFKTASSYLASRLLPESRVGNRVVILLYHSIGDNGRFFTVTAAAFAAQMEYLASAGYRVISLAELKSELDKGTIPPKTAVLTFDDGYVDNLTTALPILQRHSFPATIFVSSDLCGQVLPKTGLPICSLLELRKLQASGLIDIESHTKTHPKLPTLSADEALKEITESRDDLEQALAKPCPFFAYPFGSYNGETLALVKQSGFTLAVTVAPGLVQPYDDYFQLHRNSIDSLVNLTRFQAILRFGRFWLL